MQTTGFYGEALSVSSEVKLKDFESNINDKGKSVITGIVVPPHGTNKDYSENSLVPNTISGSGYLTINNGNRNIYHRLPIAAIEKATEENGFFPVNIPAVDFNNTFIKFGDTTSVSGKTFFIGFMYQR